MKMVAVVARTRTVVEHISVTFTTNPSEAFVERDARAAAQRAPENDWREVSDDAEYDVLVTLQV